MTLVGPTSDQLLLRHLSDPAVSLATYRMPKIARGAAGQVREMAQSFIAVARTLARTAGRTPIDILHSANPPDDLWVLLGPLGVRQKRRVRFVFDQHDAAPALLRDKYGDSGVFARAAAVLLWAERRSFAHADLVLFTSEEYRLRAEALSLMVRRHAVVANGWRLPESEPRDWHRGARWLLAYVGSINEQDNVDELVRAVAQLPSRKEVRVVVAGTGSALGVVRSLAETLQVADSFEWLGWIDDRERIASVVRDADLAIAPETNSEFNQLSSLVKLGEYMSVGTPVVAHRLAQTVRLAGSAIAYTSAASSAALAETIERLLHAPEERSEVAQAGFRRFESALAWETVGAPALVDAYKSLG